MCYKNRSFAAYAAVDPSATILFVSGRAGRFYPTPWQPGPSPYSPNLVEG
jgi:hypothetical protein